MFGDRKTIMKINIRMKNEEIKHVAILIFFLLFVFSRSTERLIILFLVINFC